MIAIWGKRERVGLTGTGNGNEMVFARSNGLDTFRELQFDERTFFTAEKVMEWIPETERRVLSLLQQLLVLFQVGRDAIYCAVS